MKLFLVVFKREKIVIFKIRNILNYLKIFKYVSYKNFGFYINRIILYIEFLYGIVFVYIILCIFRKLEDLKFVNDECIIYK